MEDKEQQPKYSRTCTNKK